MDVLDLVKIDESYNEYFELKFVSIICKITMIITQILRHTAKKMFYAMTGIMKTFYQMIIDHI